MGLYKKKEEKSEYININLNPLVEGVKTSRSPCPPGSRGSRFESIKHGSDVRGEKYRGTVRRAPPPLPSFMDYAGIDPELEAPPSLAVFILT